MATTSVVIIVVVCRVTREMATAAQTLMNAKATLFSVEFMPLVITPLVLTNASVTLDGQAAVQTAQTSTNVLMGHTFVLRTHIAQIIKAVTHVHVCMGGNVSGLNHTGDVPSAIQTPSAQVMESAYEMVLVIALGIIEELTAQYACQKSDAQAMGTVTLTGSAIVTMVGQGNHSTAAFVHQRLSAVVTGSVTTTTKPTKTSLVFAMTISLDKIAAKVRKFVY